VYSAQKDQCFISEEILILIKVSDIAFQCELYNKKIKDIKIKIGEWDPGIEFKLCKKLSLHEAATIQKHT